VNLAHSLLGFVLAAGASAASGVAPAVAAPAPALPGAAPATPSLPKLQLDGCLGLPRVELRRALERELASVSPLPSSLVVTAICEDAVSATVRVSRVDAGEQSVAERTIALGEVAIELRPRLLSIIAAELAETLPVAPPPAAPSLAFVVAAAPPAPEPPKAAPLAVEKIERSWPSYAGEAPRWRLRFRPGMRIFGDVDNPLLSLGVEVDRPGFSVGVVGGIGPSMSASSGEYLRGTSFRGHNSIGRFLPFFYAANTRVELYCLSLWESSLCAQGRLELGRAGYDIVFHPFEERKLERYATYALGAAVVEWRALLPNLEAGVFVDVGWSSGAVFYDGDALLDYDGLVTSLGLSLRWPR
jgi:hypothetical protein